MKLLISLGILVVIVLALALALAMVLRKSAKPPATPIFTSSGPTITHLQKLGQLATVRVHVADVLTAEDPRYIGAWLIKGDALIVVDMTECRISEINPSGRKAVVLVPLPSVIQPRVDHTKTRVWDIDLKTWNPLARGDKDRLRDLAMLHAQKMVEYAANRPEAIHQAQATATILIHQFYEMVDWDVGIKWAGAPSKVEGEGVPMTQD